MSKENIEKKDFIIPIWFIIAICCVVYASPIVYFIVNKQIIINCLGYLGSFGSFMNGVIGSLFTMMASILVYLAYTSQKREFTELRRRDQNKEFDNKFHNLLNLLNTMANDIEVNEYQTSKIERFNNIKRYKSTRLLQGREAFEFYYYILYEEYKDKIKSNGNANFYDDNVLQEIWRLFYKTLGNNKLRSYYKTFLFIIGQIEDNKDTVNNVNEYSELLFYQFSQYELWILLFYLKFEEQQPIRNNIFFEDYCKRLKDCESKKSFFIER
jgi:hypothetical protein